MTSMESRLMGYSSEKSSPSLERIQSFFRKSCTHSARHTKNARYSCTSLRGIRKVAGSPDHLVCLEEDHWEDGQAQDVGGLEVHDQLACGGWLSRPVRRLRVPPDFVYI